MARATDRSAMWPAVRVSQFGATSTWGLEPPFSEAARSMHLRRQVETASAGWAIDRRRRRAGTRACDRPTGHGRTVTARTSTIGDPVVVSDQRSGGSCWIDAAGG